VYEAQTFEAILQRMLSRVTDNVDKRPGSVIYDALAPAAAELAQLYAELDINYNLSFADTASGDYLTRRAAEFGVQRKPAVKARRVGRFYGEGDAPIDVPLGSRFGISGLFYTVVSKLGAGIYALECETAGAAGNQPYGALLPVDYVAGLVRAELATVIVPGEEEEDDESLRQRTAVRRECRGLQAEDRRDRRGRRREGVSGLAGRRDGEMHDYRLRLQCPGRRIGGCGAGGD